MPTLPQPAGASSVEADRLYAARENQESARQAAEIWTAQLRSDPTAFDAAWKLARARYWLGGHASEAERRSVLESGIEAGRTAVALRGNRPEGHFWIAANMGALADALGLRAGLKYRKPIKEALDTVLRLDAPFMDGSADRALGRWYFKVPRLLGGSHQESEKHLRESLRYNDRGTASHYFLAELLIDDGRKNEARAELEKVLDAPLRPEWAPEDREFKTKAQRLLQTLR